MQKMMIKCQVKMRKMKRRMKKKKRNIITITIIIREISIKKWIKKNKAMER